MVGQKTTGHDVTRSLRELDLCIRAEVESGTEFVASKDWRRRHVPGGDVGQEGQEGQEYKL